VLVVWLFTLVVVVVCVVVLRCWLLALLRSGWLHLRLVGWFVDCCPVGYIGWFTFVRWLRFCYVRYVTGLLHLRTLVVTFGWLPVVGYVVVRLGFRLCWLVGLVVAVTVVGCLPALLFLVGCCCYGC